MIPAFETQPGIFAVTSPKPRWQWWLIWIIPAAVLLGFAFYLDPAVRDWVAQHQVPAVRTFMRSVSWWGDWPQHVALALIGIGIAYARRNRRWITILVAMIVACAIAGAINRVIKIGTGRSRPYVTSDAGWKGLRMSSSYNAFPSGHTAASTAFFAALLIANRRIGLALLLIPMLIAASRMYLNAHHLSDVVAGAIVGVSSAILAWHLVSKRMPENNSHAEATSA